MFFWCRKAARRTATFVVFAVSPAVRMWPTCCSSLILTLIWAFFVPRFASGLQDVTTDLFGTENEGTVAAFGDFNSDKQTDIFVIRQQSELLIFLADLKAPYFRPKVHLSKDDFPSVISSVVPGDYDGDSQMDVLLTGHPKGSDTQQTKVFIFWGNNQTLSKCIVSFLSVSVLLFFHCSFNGDMIPDVFGVVSDSTEVCYLRVCISELMSVCLIRNLSVLLSDGDGSQDHLLPVCFDKTCSKSAVYLARPGQTEWVPVLTDFQRRDGPWGFVPPDSSMAAELQHPITLHLGDYNLDGFPDALAILHNTSNPVQQQAFLLENVPCNNVSCRESGRMFRIHWEQTDLSSVHSAVVATFFDIYEDGILDMIVLSRTDSKTELTIHALKNNFEADAYFVKVIVLSGLCSNDCPEKVKPFGVNQPGPYVMYTSVDSNGYLKNASAGQLSQSAHLSLQLPYTVLGLGRSANFLDHLFVGIPRPPGVKDMRKQEWTAIIPNSQLIVIPFPNSDPRSWSAKLYLTPSNIVLLTAIALIGVCVFILVIIGILHWQEKKADDREKRQEAHRFHFDAM
uniref:T-cell immunomodulatory protein TIP C2 domain-containing protein n=1 Tax=Pygocentrus nattereri TaxID=42514 RepID=A0AAR2LMV3_PYGNA